LPGALYSQAKWPRMQMSAEPSVREAALPVLVTSLEAVLLGVGGLGHAEHTAQIDEVGLRARALVQLERGTVRPSRADEFLRLQPCPPLAPISAGQGNSRFSARECP